MSHLASVRRLWVLGLGAMLAVACLGQPVSAQDLTKLDTSLQLIPANAAFYSSSLRGREQVELVANSRAWAKLKEMPVIQMGLAMYQIQASSPESVPGQIRAAMKNPEVKKLIALAKDMASHEVFFYGDETTVDAVALLQNVMGAMRYGPALMQLSGEAKGMSENEMQARMMLAVLSENIDLLRVPDMVVGFKVTDTAAAKDHLERLEKLLRDAIADVPELEGTLKRAKVGGHQYLTMSVDGELIPWEELPLEKLEEYEAEEGDAKKVIDALQKMTLVVAVGMRNDYLLISIGSSTDVLERLGRGESLASSPKLAPLAKFADKKLLSVQYLSTDMATQLLGMADDIEGLKAFVAEALPAAELDEEVNKRILADVDALADDLEKVMPQPGAMMGFSFLADTGIETYRYDWTVNPVLDGSKPLGLLRHLGGDPTIAVASRSHVSVKDYDTFVKWVKVGYGYFEDYGMPKIPAEERPKVEQFLAAARPHVDRMHAATRELLLPALADGQAAVVVDTKLSSRQYIKALPETSRELPMFEPAMVVGVSDAKKLVEAFSIYRNAINGLIDAARQIEGSEIPAEITLPAPLVTQTPQGAIYSFALPEDWGVDARLVLNFGLSEKVGTASISQAHSIRLLTDTAPAVGGVLADVDVPRAGAAVVDIGALFRAIKPWVDEGFDIAVKQSEGSMVVNAAASQVDIVFEVLQVFGKVTSSISLENGATVTHSHMEIRDIPE
jgi:hypothetical protein